MPDLFFYGAPEDIEKQEQQEREEAENAIDEAQPFEVDSPVVGEAQLADWVDDNAKTVEFTKTTKDWDAEGYGQQWVNDNSNPNWNEQGTADWTHWCYYYHDFNAGSQTCHQSSITN